MHDLFKQKLKELDSLESCKAEIVRQLQVMFPDLSYNCIRSRVRRYYESQHKTNTTNSDLVFPTTKDMEYKQDGSIVFNRIINLTKECDLKPVDMLLAHGMDPDKWEVITYKNNFWQTQKKGGQILNLYQSKITVKPKEQEITLEQIKEHFDKFQNTYKPTPATYVKNNPKYLYEVNIADLHLGKFSYCQETGEYLNTYQTRERFDKLINEECKKLKEIQHNVEKIIFVWTNDFFNSDGISKATTGGTPQDTELKWQQLYLVGVEILVNAITRLSQYAPVKTFYVASNHSRQTDFYALNYLYAWFRNNENVTVDRDPHPRYYVEYGVNLIGFAHSYYEKKENLPYLMSIERPKEFGRTKYREYHLAHYHCEKVEEKGGIIFRWLPSITGVDSWSNDCGYVGAVKRSYSFIYDKNKGLVQMNSTIIG